MIELLLVVLIVSILASSLAVSLQGRKDVQALRVGSEDLAAAVRLAASRAASDGWIVQVALLNDGRAFQVQVVDEQGVSQPLAGMAGARRQFAREVRVARLERRSGKAQPAEVIAFGGGDDFAGSIELTDGLGNSRRIEVADATAQVRIIE